MKGNGRERQGKEEGSADAEPGDPGVLALRLCLQGCPMHRGGPASPTAAPHNPHTSPGQHRARQRWGFAVGVQGTPPSLQPPSGCGAGAPGRCESRCRPHSLCSCSGKSPRAQSHHNPPRNWIAGPPAECCIYPICPRAAGGMGGFVGPTPLAQPPRPATPAQPGTRPTWPSELPGGSWCP